LVGERYNDYDWSVWRTFGLPNELAWFELFGVKSVVLKGKEIRRKQRHRHGADPEHKTASAEMADSSPRRHPAMTACHDPPQITTRYVVTDCDRGGKPA
jgi:hypothetical protein